MLFGAIRSIPSNERKLMSESAKFNSLFTGSIFLVSKLYRNIKGTFKSHATAKSGSFV